MSKRFFSETAQTETGEYLIKMAQTDIPMQHLRTSSNADIDDIVKTEQDFEEDGEKDQVIPHEKGESTVFQASFNMTKTIVGAGVFGLPIAYQKTGFVTVTVLIVVLGILISWTLSVLLHAGLKAKHPSYHGLMHQCYGKIGSYSYALFSFLYAFGSMSAYTVIIGDTVPIVVRYLLGIASENEPLSGVAAIMTDRRVVIVLASFLIMLPISSIRQISKLAKFSVFALGAIVVIAICLVVSGFRLDPSLSGPTEVFTIFKESGIYGAIGTLCFAYVCHHNSFLIFRSLKEPTLENFSRVNYYSLGYAMTMSLVVGIAGFVIFGTKTSSNVLNGFSNLDLVANFARFLFACDMFITYPLELFVARNTINVLIFGKTTVPIPLWFHATITLLLISSTTLIGVLTCDLGFVLDLTGGFAAAVIAFVFPSLCMIKLNNTSLIARENWAHLACVTFGLAVLVLTTWHTIADAFIAAPTQCKFINF